MSAPGQGPGYDSDWKKVQYENYSELARRDSHGVLSDWLVRVRGETQRCEGHVGVRKSWSVLSSHYVSEQRLTELGAQGWELVTATFGCLSERECHSTAYVKRTK